MIKRFVSGDYGLAKTYWFGLLALEGTSVVGFFVVFALGPVTSSAFRLGCVYFVVLCVISVSIWRASGEYKGRWAWALLAKGTVVVLWVGEIGRSVYLLAIL